MMENLKILAIDPGNVQSAYVIVQNTPRFRIPEHGILQNKEIFPLLHNYIVSCDFDPINSTYLYEPTLLIEDIESFGMPVGYTVFQTVRWTGRFDRDWYLGTSKYAQYIKRSRIKATLCGNTRARDSNVNQALRDIWGEKGNKKFPGLTYGISKDVWSALAVATTYLMQLDPFVAEKIEKLQVGVL